MLFMLEQYCQLSLPRNGVGVRTLLLLNGCKLFLRQLRQASANIKNFVFGLAGLQKLTQGGDGRC